MRKIIEEDLHETNVPQLRVFVGEEEDKGDDLCPPDPDRSPRPEWMRQEAYWAGRNHAKRFSARLVA